MTTSFRIEALSAAHDRKSFSSGVDALDRYLRECATQDIKRRIRNCFLALNDNNVIAGYYTFAATSLPLTEISAEEAKRLPRYSLLTAGLIGRLAVDKKFQGKRLGSALIMDAVVRAARGDSAIFALIVDAKNDTAIAFYEHLQFRRFINKPATLFLPIGTALQALNSKKP